MTERPICFCHGCRFEKPGLEQRIRELCNDVHLRDEQLATLRVNSTLMWNALDWIAHHGGNEKDREIAEDAFTSLLTVEATAA